MRINGAPDVLHLSETKTSQVELHQSGRRANPLIGEFGKTATTLVHEPLVGVK
jgi:hypothetical protein